ncbi:Arabinogalactan peptide 22 [Cocos nucifera]|uniref:Arabinogalactan peptide 22 n=1 Tax=Cocos nucifera TaxID=13894 RepID=A0A8K0I550_COCNU|nr:Arabinogalactan peptide 22 [Cocos nucifera]
MVAVKVYALLFVAFFLSGLMELARGQAMAPSPTSDGKAIDQGIAYALMLVALLITYLVR